MNQTHRNRTETNLAAEIKRAASAVHALLGPGLSRHAYEAGLEHECRRRGLRVERGKEFPAFYKGLRLGDAFRADLLVADAVLVQVRADAPAAALHRAELENGLRLTGKREGVSINFHVEHLAHGLIEAREPTRRRRWFPSRSRSPSARPASALPHPILGCPIEGGVMSRL